MKSTVLTFGLIFYMATCIAQKSSLNFSVQGSSSHILFIKDRPGDNYYAGISGTQRNYHFTPKMGAAIEYVTSFSEKRKLSYGIGLRYAQKGQNINYNDTISLRTNMGILLLPLGGDHKVLVHYIQLPISIQKEWKGLREYGMKFSILPEMKVYGCDNYSDLSYVEESLFFAEKYQRRFGFSTSFSGFVCIPISTKGRIFIGPYIEYQFSRWLEGSNSREERFIYKDPEITWGFTTHLRPSHLFNIGLEIGYSFGWNKKEML